VAGFVAFLCPILALVEGSAGPFDSGRPLQGLLRLVGACAAVACLATRSSDRPETDEHPVLSQATAGPVIGATALVGGSGLMGLGLPPEPAFGLALLTAMVISPLHAHLPAIPTVTRRQIAGPFLLASGGIFWSLVNGLKKDVNPADQIGSAPEVLALVLAIFVAASAIWYAMLVYGPRQIVEREGTPSVWLGRYALFVLSVIIGASWLSALGG